ncbi:MAG: phosphotransferase [Clostridia bacterium]|nr:phosphotransferase [Clostridia bacterium]
MSLFTEEINNWQDWTQVYRSINAFTLLSQEILLRHSLPIAQLELLMAGTNAVFRAGEYVVKIYAPYQSGKDQTPDMNTEIYASTRAVELGVHLPEIVGCGYIQDKYRFGYIITRFIDGKSFEDIYHTLSAELKLNFGRRLRQYTDRLNTPCEAFNNLDIFSDEYSNFCSFPDSFILERQSYKATHQYTPNVFIHADIFSDNVIVDGSGEIYLIDYADALLAPVCVEHALFVLDLFHFDKLLMQGYFGTVDVDEMVEMVLSGALLLGENIIMEYFDNPCDITTLDCLRSAIRSRIING